MRTALFGLLGLLALLAAPWTVGVVLAEDDDLTYRAFDVSILTRPRQPQWGSRLGMLGSNASWTERSEAGASDPYLSPQDVLEAVYEAVPQENWEAVAGALLTYLDGNGSTLHVRHRSVVVERVGALLYELAWRAQARVLLAVAVEEKSSEKSSIVDSASLEVPPGILSFAKATSRMYYVVDYEVEIAQGSNISNPTVETPEQGLVVEVRATPLLDGKRVMVDAIVQRGRYTDVRQHTLGVDEESINNPYRSEFRSNYGTLDLPTFDLTNLHWTAVVPNGAMIEVPVSWGGVQRTFRTRVEAQGPTGAGPVLELSHLTRPILPFRVVSNADQGWGPAGLHPPSPNWAADAEDVPPASSDSLVDLIHRIIDPETQLRLIGKSRLTVSPTKKGIQEKVRALLQAREAQAIRPVVLDVKAWSVARDAPIGSGRTVDPATSRLVAGARLPTILGRRASVQTGSTMNWLADYDVEVAQEARIADPRVGQSFEGLVANLRPHLPAEGRLVTLEVEMLLSFRTLDPEPKSLDAQYFGPVDRVTTRRSVVDQTVQVPRNGTYVIDLGPDPEDPTRKLVAELGVRIP